MLLNSAGPLKSEAEGNPAADDEAAEAGGAWYAPVTDAVVNAVKRVVLFVAFQRARQPERIREGELVPRGGGVCVVGELCGGDF